jgi:hypothetical protein
LQWRSAEWHQLELDPTEYPNDILLATGSG